MVEVLSNYSKTMFMRLLIFFPIVKQIMNKIICAFMIILKNNASRKPEFLKVYSNNISSDLFILTLLRRYEID